MVSVGGDLKDHLVPTSCHGQGHLPGITELLHFSLPPGTCFDPDTACFKLRNQESFQI